jgi:hypothetical protein
MVEIAGSLATWRVSDNSYYLCASTLKVEPQFQSFQTFKLFQSFEMHSLAAFFRFKRFAASSPRICLPAWV